MNGWNFGIRKSKKGWVITEEFGRYGYAEIAEIYGYSKKEIKMILSDLGKVITKRIKKAID